MNKLQSQAVLDENMKLHARQVRENFDKFKVEELHPSNYKPVEIKYVVGNYRDAVYHIADNCITKMAMRAGAFESRHPGTLIQSSSNLQSPYTQRQLGLLDKSRLNRLCAPTQAELYATELYFICDPLVHYRSLGITLIIQRHSSMVALPIFIISRNVGKARRITYAIGDYSDKLPLELSSFKQLNQYLTLHHTMELNTETKEQ